MISRSAMALAACTVRPSASVWSGEVKARSRPRSNCAEPRKTPVALMVEAALARLKRSAPGHAGRNCPWRSRRMMSSVSQSCSGIEAASRSAEAAGSL